MIYVVWRASVRHLKARAACNTYVQHTRLLQLQLQTRPTYCDSTSFPLSLPSRSWQTWKGLPGLGTMVTDAPCTWWQLRWFFGAEQCSLSLSSILSPSLMERSLFSYLFCQEPPPIHSLAWAHYPAKVVLSSQMAFNHDNGINCSPSLDTEREDVAFMKLCFRFSCMLCCRNICRERSTLWSD